MKQELLECLIRSTVVILCGEVYPQRKVLYFHNGQMSSSIIFLFPCVAVHWAPCPL